MGSIYAYRELEFDSSQLVCMQLVEYPRSLSLVFATHLISVYFRFTWFYFLFTVHVWSFSRCGLWLFDFLCVALSDQFSALKVLGLLGFSPISYPLCLTVS